MFGSLFSNQPNPSGSGVAALPASSIAGVSPGLSQSEIQSVCLGVQQRMQAIQSMHAGSFLVYSYVLADNPAQIQQVYNAAYQPAVHYDSGKWHEAKLRNPDSVMAYPLPVNGFSALSDRCKQQSVHLVNLVAATDNAKTQISNLKSHTDRLIKTELVNCEKRNDSISIKLSKLCLSMELYALQNCKASIDFHKHRELMDKLERIQNNLVLVQRKLQAARVAHKEIAQLAPPATLVMLESFQSLREAVDRKVSNAYGSVLDRCRSISAQSMQDRLKQKSTDFLSQLKRQYIDPSASVAPLKYRTMNSSEIAITKILSSSEEDVVEIVEKSCAAGPLFRDIFSLCANLCKGPKISSSLIFLESKFANEITRSVKVSMSASLHAYCRQHGGGSDVWFLVYTAFRAGWSSALKELAIDEYIAELLCGLIESPNRQTSVDFVRLNTAINSASSSPSSPYKELMLAICQQKLTQMKIAQVLPDCTAFDWAWWGLWEIILNENGKTKSLSEKISNLPKNYFAAPLSTLVGVPAKIEPKSVVQLCLMRMLVLEFDPCFLRNADQPFDINEPMHRVALCVSMCLDKFTQSAIVKQDKTVGIVVEAALTINVPAERNMYVTALSSETGKQVAQLFANLDKRKINSN